MLQVIPIKVRQIRFTLTEYLLNCNCVRQRTHTINFTSFLIPAGFTLYRVLIADTRSFPALTATLDYVTDLALLSCWFRADAARLDEFRLSQAALL